MGEEVRELQKKKNSNNDFNASPSTPKKLWQGSVKCRIFHLIMTQNKRTIDSIGSFCWVSQVTPQFRTAFGMK